MRAWLTFFLLSGIEAAVGVLKSLGSTPDVDEVEDVEKRESMDDVER